MQTMINAMSTDTTDTHIAVTVIIVSTRNSRINVDWEKIKRNQVYREKDRPIGEVVTSKSTGGVQELFPANETAIIWSS